MYNNKEECTLKDDSNDTCKYAISAGIRISCIPDKICTEIQEMISFSPNH